MRAQVRSLPACLRPGQVAAAASARSLPEGQDPLGRAHAPAHTPCALCHARQGPHPHETTPLDAAPPTHTLPPHPQGDILRALRSVCVPAGGAHGRLPREGGRPARRLPGARGEVRPPAWPPAWPGLAYLPGRLLGLSGLLWRQRRVPWAGLLWLCCAPRRWVGGVLERDSLPGSRGARDSVRRSRRAHPAPLAVRPPRRHVPGWVLQEMGLLGAPPHCVVSVASGAAAGEPELLSVSVEDLQRVQVRSNAPAALATCPAMPCPAPPPQPALPPPLVVAARVGG
jgi:hypothetical protein